MPEHSVRSRMRQMLPVRYAHRSINSVRLLMARVPDAEVSQLDRSIRAVLEAQAKRWGGPLLNHLIYARRPSIFMSPVWAAKLESMPSSSFLRASNRVSSTPGP